MVENVILFIGVVMATWDDLKSFLKIYEQAEIIEDNGNEYWISFEFDNERSQEICLARGDKRGFVDVLGHYVRVSTLIANFKELNDPVITELFMNILPIGRDIPIGKFIHYENMMLLTDAISIEYTPLDKIVEQIKSMAIWADTCEKYISNDEDRF